MTKKEISWFKRTMKEVETSPIGSIATCYVEPDRNTATSQEARRFALLDESEAKQYLEFCKKSLSTKINVNAFDLRISENPFEKLYNGDFSEENREDLFNTVKDSFSSGDNYCIFLADGDVDIMDDYNYHFIQMMIQPCALSKPGIVYDHPENLFHDRRRDRSLSAPIVSFLYPSIIDGVPDPDVVHVSVKSVKQLDEAKPLVEALFGIEMPVTAEQQKLAFEDVMTSPFGGGAPFAFLVSVYDRLAEIKENSEDNFITIDSVSNIVSELSEDYPSFKKEILDEVTERYKDFKFSIANILPDTVDISTDEYSIKIERQDLKKIKRKKIENVEYYLVPASFSNVDKMFVK